MKKQWVSIGGVVEIKVQILYTQDREGILSNIHNF